MWRVLIHSTLSSSLSFGNSPSWWFHHHSIFPWIPSQWLKRDRQVKSVDPPLRKRRQWRGCCAWHSLTRLFVSVHVNRRLMTGRWAGDHNISLRVRDRVYLWIKSQQKRFTLLCSTALTFPRVIMSTSRIALCHVAITGNNRRFDQIFSRSWCQCALPK